MKKVSTIKEVQDYLVEDAPRTLHVSTGEFADGTIEVRICGRGSGMTEKYTPKHAKVYKGEMQEVYEDAAKYLQSIGMIDPYQSDMSNHTKGFQIAYREPEKTYILPEEDEEEEGEQ